jgi:hypothetical protein
MRKTIAARGASFGFVVLSWLTVVTPSIAEIMTFGAAKDATLYESLNGALSGGGEDGIFAGLTGQTFNGPEDARRGLLQFDLGGIPAGATINSVSLRLHVIMAPGGAGPRPMTMHRLLGDWGEGNTVDPDHPNGGSGGTALNGDATWTHQFRPGDPWTTPGGDFVAQLSATTNVPAGGAVTWNSSPGLVADVNSWLTNPASNFGWLIKDAENLTRTARRFSSSENSTAANRPLLTIDFTVPPTRTPGDVNGDGFVDRVDVALLSANYGTTTTANNFDLGDFSGDGKVGVADLAILQRNFSPLAVPSPASVPEPASVVSSLIGILGISILAFRRRKSPSCSA